MRKNSLHTAIVAGLAGVAGLANVSNAINLNPDGLGQVLIYPYYTTNQGGTLVALSTGAAVKVRFLKALNLAEMQDLVFIILNDAPTPAVMSPQPIAVLTESHLEWPHFPPRYAANEPFLLVGPSPDTEDMVAALSQLVADTAPNYDRQAWVITIADKWGDNDWPWFDPTPEHIPGYIRHLPTRTQREVQQGFGHKQLAKRGGYRPGASGPRRTAS